MSDAPTTPLLGAIIPPPSLPAQELDLLAALDAAIASHVAPAAREHDAIGRYPAAALAALKRCGVLKAAVPAALGGPGASHRFSLEAEVRLGAADGSVAQVFKVHDELTREIFQYCPAPQRSRLARVLLHGDAVLGLAVAENGRSAVEPMTTIATPLPGGGYEVSGKKIYTTGAAEADLIATWVFEPAQGMLLLLIPNGTQGVTIHRDWDALGQRATDSGTITFDHVRCLAEWIASERGKAPLSHSSVVYQAGFAAVLVGIGIGALAAAAPFVRDQSRPWKAVGVEHAAEDPMICRAAGEIAADLAAAYAATMSTAELIDAFERGAISRGALALPISAAKSAATRAALRATSEIHGLMGARSVARKHGFDLWWRNARTLSLHDPVEWKHVELGRHVLNGYEPTPGIYQ